MLELDGDIEGRKKAINFIKESDAWAYGAPVPFPYIPYLYNDEDLAYLREVCTTAHGILCKVIQRFLDDPSYREMFQFPPEVERLILLPCGYSQLLPMGRFDLFLDEEDLSFKFCEFNTDGSGAMSRDYLIGQSLMQTDSFKRFAEGKNVAQFELFDSWVQAFMRIYKDDKHAVEHPHVAVIDFDESGVHSDFDRFIAAFERAGVPARFTDIRKLEFDGEHLRDSADGWIIDAIYRRSVTSEILQHPGECEDLINAVAAEKVCLIGHFRTTVVHSKMVNVALFDDRTKEMLTPEENAFVEAHVPRTYMLLSTLPENLLAEIRTHRTGWIIKPADDYGSHGVYPGVDFGDEEWNKLVDNNLDNGYIVQEFYQPHYVDAINAELKEGADPCEVESWESMPGVYMYDGEPVGFYCRLGKSGIIAIDHGGLCSTSFHVSYPS